MKNSTNKLETICNKYRNIQQNDDNYSIGGGLDGSKFASRRHEDAKYDEGKLTLGEATQLFKKATGLEIDTLREVIKYAVPNMEWHHAGMLPKSYGGGMKKTYFLNASEICDCAENWDAYSHGIKIDEVITYESATDSIIKLMLAKVDKAGLTDEQLHKIHDCDDVCESDCSGCSLIKQVAGFQLQAIKDILEGK